MQIPSATLQEAEVCQYYAAQLRELGFAVDQRRVTDGRYNLYARPARRRQRPQSDVEWASGHDPAGRLCALAAARGIVSMGAAPPI